MGKLKALLIDNEEQLDLEKELYEGLHYTTTIWNVVDLIYKHSFSTVMFDIVEEMKKKEIK